MPTYKYNLCLCVLNVNDTENTYYTVWVKKIYALHIQIGHEHIAGRGQSLCVNI